MNKAVHRQRGRQADSQIDRQTYTDESIISPTLENGKGNDKHNDTFRQIDRETDRDITQGYIKQTVAPNTSKTILFRPKVCSPEAASHQKRAEASMTFTTPQMVS